MTTSDPTAPTPPAPVPPLDWARAAGKVDVIRQVLEAKLKRRRRRRQTAAGAAATLIAIAVAVWAVPYIQKTDTVATDAAQRQTLALADGSVADLNARTSLHTDFRYGRRTVRLDRGEAFFSVAKDPAHPFLVETPEGTVRVTGTKFNVRLADASHIEVTLMEGSVRFAGPAPGPGNAAATPLAPGQQLAATSDGVKLRTLTLAELANVQSWRSGRLALDELTLGEAVARFAAYHDREIQVAPAVAALRLGGSCPLDDLPGFLEFLEQAFPVRIQTQADGTMHVLPR